MHSHLIPGVDDGAKDVTDSIALLTGLKELGFHHFITTPHTLQDIHPNTSEILQSAHASLAGKLPENITLELSSEYYLDGQFQEQLEAGKLMPMKDNRILVEFSQISRPHDLEETIFDLGIKGYQVILAHPERYLFFHRDFGYYKRLKQMGVDLQVNALSLTKHYGEHVKKIAEKLIEADMIDYFGTDTHHLRHIETLKQVPSSKHFNRLVDSGLLKNESLLP
ncbi:tyrosine-protein phosphatase [Pedobacter antarcticus]|nr:CpsB/CapC family capsule biosynthesis tyrosine phosphatase [Pedobacter antarcticus]